MTKVTCWPSLGQATTVTNDHVDFKVLIETDAAILDCEACIWHNHDDEYDWSGLYLNPAAPGPDAILIGSQSGPGTAQRWLIGTLGRKHSRCTSFTLKYRIRSENDEWRWIKDEAGVGDSTLLFLRDQPSSDFRAYLPHVSHNFKVVSEPPETPDTLLWHLTAPINGASAPGGADMAAISHHDLGEPADCLRWFSIVRHKEPWLGPRQGQCPINLDKDGIVVSFLRKDGLHLVCLAVNGVRHVTSLFQADGSGHLTVKGENDSQDPDTVQVLVAVASTFEIANAAVMYGARRLVIDATIRLSNDIAALSKDLKPAFAADWYDGLTYCTWNSLGQQMTADMLMDALEDLASKGILAPNLIIDDGWQTITPGNGQYQQSWERFESNERFPSGLKATVTAIRAQHPHIKHVAAWHAILGYWRGFSAKHEIAKKYGVQEAHIRTSSFFDGPFYVVKSDNVRKMYDDFYRFLADAGVDGVKTDVQFFLEQIKEASIRRSVKKTYADAWTLAHLRHLSGRAISCMSSAPHNLFYSMLPNNKPALLLRNSDDFYPDEEDSHRWHIFCNAGNALLTQHLNILPDWDMFQTHHHWSSFHAAARAVSGGPVCFTDTPGQHDMKLLAQLSARTPRGTTIALRPHRPGKSLRPYLRNVEPGLTRVGTYVGHAQTGSGIIGVFNCCLQPCSELVDLTDFPGTESGITYIIRNFEDGQVSKPFTTTDKWSFVVPRLEVKGWAIMTAHPVTYLSHQEKRVGIATLGLADKMTGVAAIFDHSAELESNNRIKIRVNLKALGILGIYIDDLDRRSIDASMMVLMYGKPIDSVQCVQRSRANNQVLEIDVGKAWDLGGHKAGFGDEIHIEVFLS